MTQEPIAFEDVPEEELPELIISFFTDKRGNVKIEYSWSEPKDSNDLNMLAAKIAAMLIKIHSSSSFRQSLAILKEICQENNSSHLYECTKAFVESHQAITKQDKPLIRPLSVYHDLMSLIGQAKKGKK